MSDGLHFPVFAEIEHTVQSRRHGDTAGIVVRGSETVEGRARIFLFPLCHHHIAFFVLDHDRIPVLVHFRYQRLRTLGEHPVHAIADAGRDVDVFEERKVGQADLEGMRHTVGKTLKCLHSQRVSHFLHAVYVSVGIHLRDEVAVLVHLEILHIPQLEVDAVLEGSGVTEGNLLIELLLAHAVLLLEGVETRDGESDVGQGKGVAGVPGVLVVQGVHAQVELAVPVVRVGNGGTHLVLLGFLHGTGVVLAVGRAGEVHRCAEGGSRVGLGILRMGPAEAEVLGLYEVGAALFTGLVVGIAEGQGAVELVIDFITGVYVYRPGSQGEVGTRDGEVEIVTQHEVHTGVTDVEAARLFLAEGRHQEAGGPGRLLRHEAEGEDQGNRNAGHHGPCRAENGLLRGFGDDLGHTKLQVIVWLLQVADRIDTFLQVDGLVRHHLDALSLQQALALLGDHIGDAGLAGIEVIPQFVHLVRLPVLRHFRQAFHLPGSGVLAAAGEDGVGLHIVDQIIGRELHILIGDGGTAVVVDFTLPVGEIRDDGVFGRRESGLLQGTLVQQVQGIPAGGGYGILHTQGIGPIGRDGIGLEGR